MSEMSAFSLDRSFVARKLFHLVSAPIIPALYFAGLIDPGRFLLILTALTFFWLFFEIARIRIEALNDFFTALFGGLMKNSERSTILGVQYLLLGATLTIYFCPPDIAVAALFFLAVGDPVAALVGARFGSIRLGSGKSLEGFVAMALVSVCVGVIFLSGGRSGSIIFLGALTAAVAELFSGWIDDNLTVPVLSGAMMTIAMELIR